MPTHVRKGDLVAVRSGKSRGQQGKILRVIPKKDQVIVEGVNVRVKHLKPSQQNPQGGRIHKEMPIHISNVSPVSDGRPTRVRFETREDGSKVRVSVRTGEPIGAPLRAAKGA